MAATKLVDACFLYYVFQVLCCHGGGSCGGGPIYTLVGVTGFSGIVWAEGGEITLICVQAGSFWGDIIGTFVSGIVICGVGYACMSHTGAAVCKSSES